MRRGFVALLLGVAVSFALAGCSASTTTSGTPTPSHSVKPQPFNVGVAVPGAPDPHDAQFIADQENLYDTSQFGDTQYYQVGYHWRIDGRIGPRGVKNVAVTGDPQSGQWAIVINFTPAAGAEFGAVTQAAFQAGQGTPLNRIAFFIGNRVVSAPSVQSPSSDSTEVTGNFTQKSAQQLADAIQAAAGV